MIFNNPSLIPVLIFSTLLIAKGHASQDQNMITCDDGREFKLSPDHGLLKKIEVAKKDGPIVYAMDEDARVYSFEYNKKANQLERTQIFRFPILGTLYSKFVDSSNSFQLPNDKNGQPMPWAVSHIQYNENARTIGLLVMTQKNPVHIRNMDPWLPPWHVYEHIGPFGITGVNISAGGQIIAIIGYNDKEERVIAYRQMTFDLSGSNPMMTYQYPSGYIKYPSWIMKKLGEKVGVPQDVTPLPTEDWMQIKLEEDYQPYARVLNKGRYIVIPKTKDRLGVYDTVSKKFFKDMPASILPCSMKWPSNMNWPAYESPLYDTPQRYDVMVDNVIGEFVETSREPEIGVFTPVGSGKTQTLYYYSSSFFETLSNKKNIYNEQGKPVEFRHLPENE